MNDFDKPKGESRWTRFRRWWRNHDMSGNLAAGAIIAIIVAVVVWGFITIKHKLDEPGVTHGTVTDLGQYAPGGWKTNPRKYSWWVDVQGEDGTIDTWSVSDAWIDGVQIGDYVTKGMGEE